MKYCDEEKNANIGILGLIITCIILLVLFNSCKQIEYVDRVQEVVRVDTHVLHDSVYVRDSIYMESKGDTVYLTKWKDKYLYKYIYKTDSVVRVDSIPYPVEIKVIEYKRSGYDRFCSIAFWTIAGLIVIALGFKIYRLRFNMR